MSLMRGCPPTNPDSDGSVPVRSRLANRFYEPIIFLQCLNVAWEANQTSKPADLSSVVAQPAEQSFHLFVNKLGQLCDNERGGKTVTAFVVLQFPDRIQYRFASNQREEEDLIRAKSFVTYVLQVLGETDAYDMQEMTSHILRKTLSFTRPRVGAYVKSLEKYTTLCIDLCEREGTKESKFILERLQKLREPLRFSNNTRLDNGAFSGHCESLINAIDLLYQSEVEELIRNKTNEGRMNESKPWCEFRHAAGRMLSYQKAVKVLVSTRKQWPELFEDFEVRYITSSRPAQCPLRSSDKTEGLTMEDIIGRMTSDPTKMEIYKSQAKELKKLGVDKSIAEQAWNKKPRLIVHAEVLVLESLILDGGTHPSGFFGGYKYIGCSKPTCRLCEYYFLFHPSGVEVRDTHRNLYINWRMPDMYPNQGIKAETERDKLMMKILDRVREDTFTTLSQKVPERKVHDSNTEPTYPIDIVSIREPGNIDQLETAFKVFDIGYSRGRVMPTSSIRGSFNAVGSFEVESSDSEEDGGVSL